MKGTGDPTYRAIGVMSGSSLDGIDLALCDLWIEGGHWKYRIEKAETIAYDDDLRSKLIAVMDGTALDLARLDVELGRRIGEACKKFLAGETLDLISSHGHTIFHKPDEGLTTQIGSGAQIAAISGITTVCDLRSMDVAFGGQGAPLVPLGEKLLFPENDTFLNLGGIANIAVHRADRVIGYDIGPCNMALNFLAQQGGKMYDEGGRIAAAGRIIPELFDRLETLGFYSLSPPRSLGREWFDEKLMPLIKADQWSIQDRMRTMVEHIASQIANELRRHSTSSVMITGGGAYNSLLLEQIGKKSGSKNKLPEKELIEFKEALIFALLGVLRIRHEPNSLSSVTGAKNDPIGGSVYFGTRTSIHRSRSK